MATFFSLLLIIFASMFIAQESVQANLYADVDGAERDFQSQMVMAAILNNETLRNRTAYYKNHEMSWTEGHNKILNPIEDILSQQSPVYYFEIKDTDLNVSSGSRLAGDLVMQRLSFTSARLASPSEEPVEIIVGVGDEYR